jgi:lipopolysaccharide export system permease protein
LKIIDKYIIRNFLGTFLFIMAVIMSIAVVFDVSEKIDDFLKNKAPLKAILIDYYLNFVLYYGNLFSALLIFISVIFFTTKLANRTEFIAILSSGVSFKRLLLPYFVAATTLVVISLFLNHYLIPRATQERLAFERQYIGSGYTPDRINIHREISPGTIAYFQLYSTSQEVGYKFSLEQWNDAGQLEYKLIAERAAFDSTTGKWQVHNFYERFFLPENQGERVETGTRMDTTLLLVPDDLYFKVDFAAAFPYQELKDVIALEKKRGSDTVTFYEIELYQRTSYPFATYVLTLIAVSIASRKVRGGLGLNLVFGFIVVFIYIFSMRLTTVAATNAGMDPLIAVWIPNIMFGVMGAFMYRVAPK